MSNVLFRKDYLAAIETCQYSMSSIGLKNFIDDLLNGYSPYNKDIISTLMEHTLMVFDKVEKQRGLENLYKKDYSNFNEELSKRKLPQLQYLYSYLLFLSKSDLGFNNKLPPDNSNNIENNLVITEQQEAHAIQSLSSKSKRNKEPLLSFKSDLTDKQLGLVCDLLVSFECIEVIDHPDFIKIFREVPLPEIKNKIRWKALYREDEFDNVLLYFVLSNLVDRSTFYISTFFSRLKFLFSMDSPVPTLRKSRREQKWTAPKKRRIILDVQTAFKKVLQSAS
jgi:hypothetical protein